MTLQGTIGLAIASMLVSAASAQIQFGDVTTVTGLDGYIASAGDYHSPGGVFADLDGDGFADLYLVTADAAGNQLYLNVDDGGNRVFVAAGDVGLADTGAATGAILADYDNDGDGDLYVTNFDEPNVLYQNQLAQTGRLAFVDVTLITDPTPGIADDQHGVGMAFFDGVALDNSMTAAWGDVDRDGDLDLYVGNHNGWYLNIWEGPFDVPGRRDVFYLNNGDGTFTDATAEFGLAGFELEDGGFQTANQRFSSTNAVIFADLDNDRWPDLFVTNKIGGPDDADMLYMNRGDGGTGTWLGFDMITYDLDAPFGLLTGAAMGVDVGDADNDGDLDIYMTDWSNPATPQAPGSNEYYRNELTSLGTVSFLSIPLMTAKFSWGTQWADFDNDGWQDLHVATNIPFSDVLYRNLGGVFIDVAATAGVAQARDARGEMTADYDRDGWIDLFVVNLDGGSSVLYRNESAAASSNHWLAVKLLGNVGGNGPFHSSRDAIGARAIVHADLDGNGTLDDDEALLREVVSGSSNAASTSSLELEFGTGQATELVLEVLWPSGKRTAVEIGADQHLLLDEATILTGDINADGVVNVVDMLNLLAAWGPCDGCPEDLDGFQGVNILDLLTLLANWT